MRRIVFWLHLTAGSVAGIVVLIMSVTGVLLTFERQITSWADRGFRQQPGSRLPIEMLVANAAAHAGAPSTVTIRSDPAAPLEVSFGRDRVIYVDASTGQVLGEGSRAVRQFLRKVEDWHRWLGADAENRAAGRAITGACNLAFLFLVITGPYLWLPRKWSGRNVAAIGLFRGGLSGRA